MARTSIPFDEELLSGYLDGTLSHRENQRVRIHLEDDADARQLLEEMRALRETAMATRFVAPPEDLWPELPANPVSRFSRPLGWMVLALWLVLVSGLALWKFLSSTGDPLEIFLVLGLPGAFLLLFVSVLADRVKSLKTDRYRGVHR